MTELQNSRETSLQKSGGVGFEGALSGHEGRPVVGGAVEEGSCIDEDDEICFSFSFWLGEEVGDVDEAGVDEI